MKLSYFQIEQILVNPTTKNLLDKTTGLFGLQLSRAIAKLSAEIKLYNEAMQKIQEKYAIKNEDGTIKSTPQGEFTVVDFGGDVVVASKEINELRSGEVEVSIEPIEYDPEAERNKDITGSEILAILPLLKE